MDKGSGKSQHGIVVRAHSLQSHSRIRTYTNEYARGLPPTTKLFALTRALGVSRKTAITRAVVLVADRKALHTDDHCVNPYRREPTTVHLNQLKCKGLSKSRSEPCLGTKKRERKAQDEDSTSLNPFRTLFPPPAKGTDMRKETARHEASSVRHTRTCVRAESLLGGPSWRNSLVDRQANAPVDPAMVPPAF